MVCVFIFIFSTMLSILQRLRRIWWMQKYRIKRIRQQTSQAAGMFVSILLSYLNLFHNNFNNVHNFHITVLLLLSMHKPELLFSIYRIELLIIIIIIIISSLWVMWVHCHHPKGMQVRGHLKATFHPNSRGWYGHGHTEIPSSPV